MKTLFSFRGHMIKTVTYDKTSDISGLDLKEYITLNKIETEDSGKFIKQHYARISLWLVCTYTVSNVMMHSLAH